MRRLRELIDKATTRDGFDPSLLSATERNEYNELSQQWYDDNRAPRQVLSQFI
jgi:hypothetical protein